jgi:hypothetical protein
MCDANDLPALLRESFDLGVKAAHTADMRTADAATQVAIASVPNVYSLSTYRASRKRAL